MLTLLSTSGFAYRDNLENCIKDEFQEEQKKNKINPAIEKLSEILKTCNEEMNNDDLRMKIENIKELNKIRNFCADFNKKIDFDQCFVRGMGWVYENDTKMNYIQLGQDFQDMADFMGSNEEGIWEKLEDCMFNTKNELVAKSIPKCKTENHGVDRWNLSALARCAMAAIKAKCEMKSKN